MEFRPPFFIVGAPRSGTTLMAVLLNSHSQLYVGKSTVAHALLAVHRNLLEAYGRECDVRRPGPAERLRQFVQAEPLLWDMCRHVPSAAGAGLSGWLAHARSAELERHGKQIWGDKSPFMLNYMPMLAHCLPGVRFIHLIRDGRAVAQSRHQRRGYHPELAIHEWKRMIQQGRVDGEILGPERYLEVRFEALLAEPPREVARVCAFLGVPFEAAMLDLSRAEGTDQPDAYVGTTFDLSKVDAWQHAFSDRGITALEEIAGDLLQALGYPLRRYTPEGPFRPLSPLAVIWLNEQLSFQDLFQRSRTTMIDQRMVEISTPLRVRLRRFLSESAAQVLSDQVLEHFRRRRFTLTK